MSKQSCAIAVTGNKLISSTSINSTDRYFFMMFPHFLPRSFLRGVAFPSQLYFSGGSRPSGENSERMACRRERGGRSVSVNAEMVYKPIIADVHPFFNMRTVIISKNFIYIVSREIKGQITLYRINSVQTYFVNLIRASLAMSVFMPSVVSLLWQAKRREG